MPDTIQNASTSHQPSTLPANGERRSADAPRPGCARPTGLPIFSTEPLTTAEKALLELTSRAHRRHADLLDAVVREGRVATALAAMQELAELAERDARTALLLGSNR